MNTRSNCKFSWNVLFGCTAFFAQATLPAAGLHCDLSQYRPQSRLEAVIAGDALVVTWEGAQHKMLRLRLGIDNGTPTIRTLEVRRQHQWETLGRNLVSEFGVTTGVRRSGHGLPEENRWDVYWDAPLNVPGPRDGNSNLPRKPEEVRRASATYHSTNCKVRTNGARLEISFPGVSMGLFAGELRFTVYRGINLIRQEIIASTQELSVAYKYYGGLMGFAQPILERVVWRDVGGNPQEYDFGGSTNEQPVALRARNRLAVVEGRYGAIAVFPPPHQFFFPRQLEVNLGYVWYRKDGDRTFSIGIRQGDNHEGYNAAWIERVFPLYNAPAGTAQHMAVYFYVSPEGAEACRDAVLAFTHHDRYKPLPGYKTMATHFHTAFTQELMQAGNLDLQPPWIPTMRALGINIAHIFDFHGDGHPTDPGPLRLKELENFFAACRRHSDSDFLILPGEEANAYLGGHYNILFPTPVYWTHVRAKDQPLVENHPKYGKVYHTGNAADVFELMRLENALVWQTHPRTKGSTFYPDRIRDTDYFRSENWLGAGFKALPMDLSQSRLGEIRCFGTLDDMNNWGDAKYLVGEVDTYKKFPEYDVYGDFNINYVKLEAPASGPRLGRGGNGTRTPRFNDWSGILRALRAGEFFVTTGEVLIRNSKIQRSSDRVRVEADLEWTFPLEFVEVVWGDGTRTDRQIVTATDLPAFGTHRFYVDVPPENKKWVRFAAWDSAGNGAFTQPVHLR